MQVKNKSTYSTLLVIVKLCISCNTGCYFLDETGDRLENRREMLRVSSHYYVGRRRVLRDAKHDPYKQ
jgi:hypothetical protein